MLYFYLRDTVKASIYRYRSKRKVYGFELNPLENEVLKMYQSIFYKALIKEIECTTTAFIIKQQLYAKDAGKKDKLSDEDRAALIRSRDMEKVEINKQLSTAQLPAKTLPSLLIKERERKNEK